MKKMGAWIREELAKGRPSVRLTVALGLAAAFSLSWPVAGARAETAIAGQPLAETIASAAVEPKAEDQADLPPAASTRALPAVTAGGPEGYRAIAKMEAQRAGLPPEIADSVMAVESGYNPGAIGGAGEIGLMQILPSTARMLGFVGTAADLAVPQTNIHYGVTYLAQAWHLAGGDICTAVMKYRAGHGETRFSYRSVDYCLAVRSKLAARGYHVTGVVPVATFGETTAGATGCRRRCLAAGSLGHINLAALNTQLSALVTQVHVRAIK